MEKAHALVAAFLAFGGSGALAAPPSGFDAIDRGFACPEALPSGAARVDALRSFMAAVSRVAPKANIAQMLLYRHTLLVKHGCAQTLASLAGAERAIAEGAYPDESWSPLGPNAGPLKLFASTSFLRPFDDPRAPGERAVETYIKMTLATPQETNVTHVTYDAVISHAVYYCQSGRYGLVENNYLLAGKLVLKDASPPARAQNGGARLFEFAPITSGSPNAAAAQWVCAAPLGDLTPGADSGAGE